MKTESVMDSLFAAKSFKGHKIAQSGFDGRTLSNAPAQDGFAQSFKNMQSSIPAEQEASQKRVLEQGSGVLKDITQKLKEWAVRGTKQPNEAGNTDAQKSIEIADNELSLIDSKPSPANTEEGEPQGIESLGMSRRLSENMSGQEILEVLAQISVRESIENKDLMNMDLEQIEQAVASGMISLDQLKNIQQVLSRQGVEVSVMDLQKVLTLSGYERASQGNQAFYVKPEASPASETSGQLSGSPLKASSSDFISLVKENRSASGRSLDGFSFNQILQSSNPTQVSLDGSQLRVDGSALNAQKLNAVSEWSPVVVNKQSPEWNKELVSALGDRLKMQVGQGVKEATVRLDPPELGRVDFSVRIDGDRVHVQINSNNAQVREMLAQQIDRLRGELLSDNSGSSVDVNVGSGKGGEQRDGDNLANKNNVNTILQADNELESTSDMPSKNKNLGLNTKA